MTFDFEYCTTALLSVYPLVRVCVDFSIFWWADHINHYFLKHIIQADHLYHIDQLDHQDRPYHPDHPDHSKHPYQFDHLDHLNHLNHLDHTDHLDNPDHLSGKTSFKQVVQNDCLQTNQI